MCSHRTKFLRGHCVPLKRSTVAEIDLAEVKGLKASAAEVVEVLAGCASCATAGSVVLDVLRAYPRKSAAGKGFSAEAVEDAEVLVEMLRVEQFDTAILKAA